MDLIPKLRGGHAERVERGSVPLLMLLISPKKKKSRNFHTVSKNNSPTSVRNQVNNVSRKQWETQVVGLFFISSFLDFFFLWNFIHFRFVGALFASLAKIMNEIGVGDRHSREGFHS
jgi:hypothetical protein